MKNFILAFAAIFLLYFANSCEDSLVEMETDPGSVSYMPMARGNHWTFNTKFIDSNGTVIPDSSFIDSAYVSGDATKDGKNSWAYDYVRFADGNTINAYQFFMTPGDDGELLFLSDLFKEYSYDFMINKWFKDNDESYQKWILQSSKLSFPIMQDKWIDVNKPGEIINYNTGLNDIYFPLDSTDNYFTRGNLVVNLETPGAESVNTTAGSFNANKYVFSSIYEGPYARTKQELVDTADVVTLKSKYTFWFAPNVGIVKFKKDPTTIRTKSGKRTYTDEGFEAILEKYELK